MDKWNDYALVLAALEATPTESLYEAALRVRRSGEGRTDIADIVLPTTRVQWECIAAAADLARRPKR